MTRLARAGGSLPERLGDLARTIGESLGYETVAITLYSGITYIQRAASLFRGPPETLL